MKDRKFDHLVQTIAANVKCLREKRGWTQESMVKHGYSYRHYQRVESGKHTPSLYSLYRLAQTFKVEIWELFK